MLCFHLNCFQLIFMPHFGSFSLDQLINFIFVAKLMQLSWSRFLLFFSKYDHDPITCFEVILSQQLYCISFWSLLLPVMLVTADQLFLLVVDQTHTQLLPLYLSVSSSHLIVQAKSQTFTQKETLYKCDIYRNHYVVLIRQNIILIQNNLILSLWIQSNKNLTCS